MCTSVYKAEFMTHLQIHTPEKKPACINCATQHHHLVTKFVMCDRAKQKGKSDFRSTVP